MTTLLKLSALALVLTASAACADPTEPYEPIESEFQKFQLIYPVLIRDCGFHTCHGAQERIYQVWGPGRARLDEDARAFDGLSGDEASASYLVALSMVDLDNPEQSEILRKPLAVAAGGDAHGGVDSFGRDVYRTVNDTGYTAIARWVFSLAEASREEPAEDDEEQE